MKNLTLSALALFGTLLFALFNASTAMACPGGNLTVFKDGESATATLDKSEQVLMIEQGYELRGINSCHPSEPRYDLLLNKNIIDVSCYYKNNLPLKFAVSLTNEPNKLLYYKISRREMNRFRNDCGSVINPVKK